MSIPFRDAPLPTLVDGPTQLREVRFDDAAALTELFAMQEVSAHLSPPPDTPEAFEEWIDTSLGRRREGRAICYTVMHQDAARAEGLFMALRSTPVDDHAEIGFALAPRLWGTGVFAQASHLYISCVFACWPDVERLIGKTLARNHRGLGAMRKLGATIVEQVVREGEPEFVWAIDRHTFAARTR